MFNKGLYEILSNRYWDMKPSSLHAFRDLIEKNLSFHIPLEMEPEELRMGYLLSSRTGFQEKVYVGSEDDIDYWYELEEEDRIINVINITAPITRNGGGCSYGSKEHRDLLMKAADNEHTIGHIMYIDSPGGSAFSRNDYKMAVDYLHDKGQKIIAVIDGMCCSAAYAAASLCDEIYFVDGSDEVGCIGTMCVTSTNTTGDQNTVTMEKYIELYGEGSPFKNIEYREAAVGNMEPLQKEVDRLAGEFKQMVHEVRPAVTEEQLLGGTYRAKDVVGTLVDREGGMAEAVSRILEWNEEKEPQQTAVNEPQPADPETDDNQEQKIEKEMKDYQKIKEYLGNQELESDANGGLYLQEELCEQLETKISQVEENHRNEIEGINKSNQQVVEDLQQQLKDSQEQLAAKEKELSETLESMNAKVTGLENTVSELNVQVSEAVKKAEDALKEKDELQKEVEELSKVPTPAPVPEAPKGNAVGAVSEQTNNVCKEGMTRQEKREALKRRNEELRAMTNGSARR